MTHEVFRRRLEALEEARKLRDGPVQTISINFVSPDKTPVEATVARTANCDFECWRLEGESADDFKSRAHAEAHAADPRPPVQILIFGDQ
jgi:hypothetical protein